MRKKLRRRTQTPQRQVHALLGALSERTTPNLKEDTTAMLTKLLHTIQTFSNDKQHDLPKRLPSKNLSELRIRPCRRMTLDPTNERNAEYSDFSARSICGAEEIWVSEATNFATQLRTSQRLGSLRRSTRCTQEIT
jgi:hypothetical protein